MKATFTVNYHSIEDSWYAPKFSFSIEYDNRKINSDLFTYEGVFCDSRIFDCLCQYPIDWMKYYNIEVEEELDISKIILFTYENKRSISTNIIIKTIES